ncbi:50S ribosomal protein L11 [Candidatus Woesearchaeota archaeon]|nr:50S ribosomal protein L11 [Candidatus Woesearchaeota archaeon]
MAKETVDVLIVGGKATAAPPLGPALGPKGVNIGKVVEDINKKTADFAGMQVPVKVIIDTETKSYEIELGTPPASALIKQELGIKKGAGNPLTDVVGDLSFDQVLKITRMKSGNLTGKNNKMKAKEIIGTCRSLGVTIDGKKASVVHSEIDNGDYDAKLN